MSEKYNDFFDELESLCEKHGVVLVCSHSGTCIEVHSSNGRTIGEAEVYEDVTYE